MTFDLIDLHIWLVFNYHLKFDELYSTLYEQNIAEQTHNERDQESRNIIKNNISICTLSFMDVFMMLMMKAELWKKICDSEGMS